MIIINTCLPYTLNYTYLCKTPSTMVCRKRCNDDVSSTARCYKLQTLEKSADLIERCEMTSRHL